MRTRDGFIVCCMDVLLYGVARLRVRDAPLCRAPRDEHARMICYYACLYYLCVYVFARCFDFTLRRYATLTPCHAADAATMHCLPPYARYADDARFSADAMPLMLLLITLRYRHALPLFARVTGNEERVQAYAQMGITQQIIHTAYNIYDASSSILMVPLLFR